MLFLTKTCADCIYFLRLDATTYGRCRRYPAQIDSLEFCDADDPACGEFQTKPPVPA